MWRKLRKIALLKGASSIVNIFGSRSIHNDLFDCSEEGQILADIEQAQTDYSVAKLTLEKIRFDASEADPNLKMKLRSKLEEQRKLPKLPNAFKTADQKDLELYFKKENL